MPFMIFGVKSRIIKIFFKFALYNYYFIAKLKRYEFKG